MKVVKVDVAASPASPARFAVRGIPTLLIIKEGKVVEQILGAVTKTRLTQALAAVLGP